MNITRKEYAENPHWVYEFPIDNKSWNKVSQTNYYNPYAEVENKIDRERLMEDDIEPEEELIIDNKPKLLELITKLTTIQKEVLKLHLKGLNQVEIAKILGKHQTTIHKTLYGNWNEKYNKYYGGVINKLKNLNCDKNRSDYVSIKSNIDLISDCPVPTYKATCGEKVIYIYNIQKFCKLNKTCPKTLYNHVSSKKKYRGWKFEKIQK